MAEAQTTLSDLIPVEKASQSFFRWAAQFSYNYYGVSCSFILDQEYLTLDLLNLTIKGKSNTIDFQTMKLNLINFSC